MSYIFRPISLSELALPIHWAAQEGWNPGLADAEAFYATDPQGFLMGFLDGQPISSISAVAYDNSFGFIGFYIVKPEFRGQGYGLKIWQAALKYLKTQNVALDGVLAEQGKYQRSGFKLTYHNYRWQGIGLKRIKKIVKKPLVLLDKIPFTQLLAYDSQIFPTARPKFLQPWIKQPWSLAIGYLNQNKLVGYGMVRPCQTGFKVGPLFADSVEIADIIFTALRQFIGPKELIFFDTPELNPQALALAAKYKMIKMFETVRMYSRHEPKIPLQKVFGVTSFELG